MSNDKLRSFLAKIPKVELHCHLAGAVRAATFLELAKKNGIEVPQHASAGQFHWQTLDDFLQSYRLVSQSLHTRDDFRRTAYETLEDAVEFNVRYREMFWSPTDHLVMGVPFITQLEGLIDGIQDAEKDFGIQCRMIAAVDREKGPDLAVELVELMVEQPCDELIGLGADYNTTFHPPEAFWKAFRLAGDAGFYRTSHVCEFGHPARDAEACLDVLSCDRLDHGYTILEDENLVQRCLDDGIVITVCPTAFRYGLMDEEGIIDWYKHPIKEMGARDLKITINPDDPNLHRTDSADAYARAVKYSGFTPADCKASVINGIDGAWVDESVKRQWREEWSQEIDALIAQLDQ
jgi:adenosine deaminase